MTGDDQAFERDVDCSAEKSLEKSVRVPRAADGLGSRSLGLTGVNVTQLTKAEGRERDSGVRSALAKALSDRGAHVQFIQLVCTSQSQQDKTCRHLRVLDSNGMLATRCQ
jgi:hypothetical protein